MRERCPPSAWPCSRTIELPVSVHASVMPLRARITTSLPATDIDRAALERQRARTLLGLEGELAVHAAETAQPPQPPVPAERAVQHRRRLGGGVRLGGRRGRGSGRRQRRRRCRGTGGRLGRRERPAADHHRRDGEHGRPSASSPARHRNHCRENHRSGAAVTEPPSPGPPSPGPPHRDRSPPPQLVAARSASRLGRSPGTCLSCSPASPSAAGTAGSAGWENPGNLAGRSLKDRAAQLQ